jgi:hypothetical protein
MFLDSSSVTSVSLTSLSLGNMTLQPTFGPTSLVYSASTVAYVLPRACEQLVSPLAGSPTASIPIELRVNADARVSLTIFVADQPQTTHTLAPTVEQTVVASYLVPESQEPGSFDFPIKILVAEGTSSQAILSYWIQMTVYIVASTGNMINEHKLLPFT